MMPDLGKYADAVLGAYAATIVLILLLVLVSVMQSRRAKAALKEIETRRNG